MTRTSNDKMILIDTSNFLLELKAPGNPGITARHSTTDDKVELAEIGGTSQRKSQEEFLRDTGSIQRYPRA